LDSRFCNGHDWTDDRFPLIAEAALRHRSPSFVLDGEAVLLGVDGISDFDGLHSRKHDDEVQFYTFDVLMADGDDAEASPIHAQIQPRPDSRSPRQRHLHQHL
jgi:ATP-dependent DNA ligase